MTRRTTDDVIYRYQPRLIEVRGIVLAVAFRYVSIACFVPAFAVTWLLPHWLLGMSAWHAVWVATLAASLFTYRVVTFLEGDSTMRGLGYEAAAETRTWWALRRAAARQVRDARPYRYRASRTAYRPTAPE